RPRVAAGVRSFALASTMSHVRDLPALARAQRELAEPLDGVEAGRPDQLFPGAGAGLPEDDGVLAVGAVAADRERHEAREPVVLLNRDEGAVAEPGDPLEGEELVAEVDQDRPAEDEVEAAELLGGRVVDAETDPLDGGA